MSAATVIETYIQTVTLQPTFDKYDAVPDLQTYQENSKKTAENWVNTVRTNILHYNTDLLSFTLRLHKLHDGLSKSAKTIENAQSKKTFDEGVSTLCQDLDKKAENVKNVVEAINNWHDQLHHDYQQKLRHKATIVVHIKSLNDKITALTPPPIETTDPNETSKVAVKSEQPSPQVIEKSDLTQQQIDQLAQSEEVATQTEEVAAQTGEVAAQPAEVNAVSALTEEEIATQKAEIATLTAEIARLQDLDKTLTPLILTCIYALRGVNTMLQQWQYLRINVKHLQDSVVRLPTIPQAWLSAELEDSINKWKVVLKNAQDISRQLQVTQVN